jgi:riboflavin synthase alpha subunit
MTHTQKAVAIPLLALTVLGSGAMLGYAQLSKADTDTTATASGMMGMREHGNGVHGKITAIDGNSITIVGMNDITYIVDASDATVKKFEEGTGPVDTSLADLAVGDMIGVRGEIDGTSVDATDIMAGHPGKGMGMGGHRGGHGAMGEVIAVDGTTITIKGPDGTSYTIDASEATVSRMVEGSIGDIEVGDRIGAQGTIDGTSIDAKHIMDDMKEPIADEQ